MSWFTENPLPPVLIGVILEALLVVVLMRTGKKSVLWGMVGLAALVAGIVVLERSIVTPREEVKQAIEEIRALVEANDRPALLQRIDSNPGVAELRNRVQSDLAQVHVDQAKVTDLRDEDIKIDAGATRANVTLIGSVDVSGAAKAHIVLKFEIDLRKRDGQWILTAAQWRSPLER
ncbi:MAG: hypothetical protein C0483_06540 [Pirellula sp.]|nr:hypothetical protein [Pirellula sp.]